MDGTSATAELRRLLDERGMEWEDHPAPDGYMLTKWTMPDGRYAGYCEDRRGCSVGMDADPAQAVEVTLGRGTCKDIGKAAVFKCSACGWYATVFAYVKDMPRFCPSCGREVAR